MFTVRIRATSVLIQPGKEAMGRLTPLINLHTFEDEYQDLTRVMGFMYDEDSDTLYFHKGIDINYLRRLLVDVEFVQEPFDPFREMKYEFEEIIPPRDADQVDFIDFIAGRNAHKSNLNDSQIFLVAATGIGKFEPYSRKIPTPTENGFTLMGDLKVGDKVFSRDGNPTTVIGIFEQGEQDVYQITFKDGRRALCGSQHLWKVKRSSGGWMVLKTEELIKRYKVPNGKEMIEGNRRDIYDYLYYIPTTEVVQYPEKPVPIDPWVLGCFIGNGCCRERRLTISSGNSYVPRKIAEICGFKVKRNSEHNWSYGFYSSDGKPIHTSEFFREIPEFIMAYSRDKTIPNVYLYNSPDVRMRLFQGLMDTDGSISQCGNRFHVSYSSTSYKLLKQIQWLLYSFGWSGRIIVDKRGSRKYTSGFCGIVIFRIPNSCKRKLFTYPEKLEIANRASQFYQKDMYSLLLIKDIRFSHRENCRCIMVDNPEHLYLTEDFIVTHNTFCAGYGLGLYGVKTLIVMHRDNLRTQWFDSLYNMNGFSSKEVHEITSSEEVEDIAHNRHTFDYDIYLMTHATFRAGCKRLGSAELISNITKNLGIGLKIIDEAHLEFNDTLLMDFLFNVKRNLYLTATDGRSSKNENSIFKHVFSNTTFYRKKPLNSNHPDKWVDYITVEINTHVNPNIYRYRVNGGKGMSAITYGKWVIQRDKQQRHFKVCVDIIKEIYSVEPTAKVLVFMPLIDLCTECAYYISRTLNYDETFDYDLNVKTVNSHNSKQTNENNKRADVIVTTIQSLGTGSDIKGITDIICCSPMVSRIVTKQVLGRIRYIDKPCHYYDIIDRSVPTDIFWWKSRSRTLKSECRSFKHLTWEEDIKGDEKDDTKTSD